MSRFTSTLIYSSLLVFFCVITIYGVHEQQGFQFRKWVVAFRSSNGSLSAADDAALVDSSTSSPSKPLPRVLCMINHKAGNEEKAKAVLDTWVKRCDGYAFVSTEVRVGSPTIIVNKTESRTILWAKVQAMIRYAYSRQDDFDWFLKADDDTYVIMENLRFFLAGRSVREPVYIGTEFKKMKSEHPHGGFLSGGAGYVFSRKAIQLIVKKGFDANVCDLNDYEVEEVLLERCVRKVGVHHDGKTLDESGRGRFFPYSPKRHFTPGNEDLDGWLRHRLGNRMECCSDSAISFHYITPINMYILEYFIYILKPYGVAKKRMVAST